MVMVDLQLLYNPQLFFKRYVRQTLAVSAVKPTIEKCGPWRDELPLLQMTVPTIGAVLEKLCWEVFKNNSSLLQEVGLLQKTVTNVKKV